LTDGDSSCVEKKYNIWIFKELATQLSRRYYYI